jgi:hypothetical protein
MRGLPLDHRGFPVPWFVAWVDAKGNLWDQGRPGAVPDFRVVDQRKLVRCVKEKRCWLCGQPLGRFMAFVIGPMCAITRVNSEPPSHRDCAQFALWACPFLSRPRMRRNEVGLPPEKIAPAGIHLDHNPGAMCLWVTTSYQPFKPDQGQQGGVLFQLGEPLAVHWYAEGRAATEAELVAAIAKGLPQLRAITEQQGGGAVETLDREIARFNSMARTFVSVPRLSEGLALA